MIMPGFVFGIIIILAIIGFAYKFIPAWRNAGVKDKVDFIEEIKDQAESIKDISVEKFQKAKSAVEKIKNI